MRAEPGGGGPAAGPRARALACLLAALLAGCASSPERPRTEAVDWPEQTAPAADETVYRVTAERSALRIIVRPNGAMARLGHAHVIGGPAISGEIVRAVPFERSRLDLRIDLDRLVLDRPAWREAEGFAPEMDAGDIADTRRNLLGEAMLDAARFPAIEMRSVAIAGPPWQPDVTLRIRLRGEIRERTVPVSVHRGGDRLDVRGQLRLNQTDFGLEPFSAAGGALRVADEVVVRFRIVANRINRVE